MYSKTFAVLFLAVAAATTPVTASLFPRQDGVTCQTTDASALTEDVTAAINQLRGDGTDICDQTNGSGSDCTTLLTVGTASIGFCGATTGDEQGPPCSELAQYATQIQSACLDHGQVGGTFTISAGQRVVVF